jgi:hypothetical protein
LPGGEDWLLAPVLAGLCSIESLLDGSLDILYIALLNDALMVKADNEEMARQKAESSRGK